MESNPRPSCLQCLNQMRHRVPLFKTTGDSKTSGGSKPYLYRNSVQVKYVTILGRDAVQAVNPLNSELNPICYLLALLGAHHFLHVSRIRVKLLTLR